MKGYSQKYIYLLVICNILMMSGDLPQWVVVTSLLFVSARWIGDILFAFTAWSKITLLFLIFSLLGLWFEFGIEVNFQSMGSLLLLMVAVKTFSIRNYRDLMVAAYLCLIILMGKLVLEQSMISSFYLFFDLMAILTLMHFYHLSQKSLFRSWWYIFRVLLFSSPIVMTLFLLFPRFNFKMIGVSPLQTSSVSSVGFSGEINLNTTNNLSNGDEIVFRAFFNNNAIPPQDQLYWRGAVLSEPKGMNWSSKKKAWVHNENDFSELKEASSLQQGSDPFSVNDSNLVKVVLESVSQKNLFILDWPLSVKMSESSRQYDVIKRDHLIYELKSSSAVRESYFFSYSPIPKEIRWSNFSWNQELKSEPMEPQTEKLVGQWREKKIDTRGKLDLIRKFIVDNNFIYSLNAPNVKSLEEFLFYSRQGYCEHFASAVTQLLRYLEVPAHVVVGYQGGKVSLLRDYVIVSSKDAHAWVEYWSTEKKRWDRIDPTLWVAAERILQGSEKFFSEHLIDGGLGVGNMWVSVLMGSKAWDGLEHLRLILDQMEISWTQLLLHYDLSQQKKFLKKWGFFYLNKLSLLGLFLVFIVLVFSLFWYLNHRQLKNKLDLDLQLYLKLCQLLKAMGLNKPPSEGPYHFSLRAQEQFPQIALQLHAVFNRFIESRYCNKPLSKGELRLYLRACSEMMRLRETEGKTLKN